jgi:hypothetical protein
MFRKLPTVLPIAILLGAVSAAPALAQTRSHHVVKSHGHLRVSPVAYGSDGYDSYAMQPGQSERPYLGEAPAVPWTQDPLSPGG